MLSKMPDTIVIYRKNETIFETFFFRIPKIQYFLNFINLIHFAIIGDKSSKDAYDNMITNSVKIDLDFYAHVLYT